MSNAFEDQTATLGDQTHALKVCLRHRCGVLLAVHFQIALLFAIICFLTMVAVLLRASDTIAAQASGSGYSFPPDSSSHYRAALPGDRAVSTPPAVPQLSGPPIRISLPVDVNDVDFNDGSEPSIAINPENPNLIVVHGGFSDWGGTGANDASAFVSTDGGTTWDRRFSIDPPSGGNTASAPHDTTVSYGGNSVLVGSFLGDNGDIFTGSTTGPYTIGSFSWNTINGTTQNTALITTTCNDQPWVTVNSHAPDQIFKQGQPQIIFPPRPLQNDTYVAYDDFFGWSCSNPATPSVPLHVAVSPTGAIPPDFTADNVDGSTAEGPNVGINPGHRLAVAPTTVMPDGTVVSNLIYSLYQTCKDCSASPPLIAFMINRTRDRGGTWTLNGSSSGVEIDEAFEQEPTPKFGTVNALLGGIDQLATDPGDGQVFVVYGVLDKNSGNFGLAMSRMFYNLNGDLTPGPRVWVSEDPTEPGANVHAALPAVAVAANGTVGVLWDNYEGMDLTTGFPAFTARIAVADGHAATLTFTEYTILRFLSPAKDNNDSRQRVWGDYQQMVALGNKFYGVFAGNGATLGRSAASTDPIFFTADVSVPTAIPTPSPTATPTSTSTPVPTQTPTRTATATHTHTATPSPTPPPPLCVPGTPAPIVPAPTPTPPPGHPVISSVSNPVQVGGTFTIDGSGFTKGSVVNFFINTANGPINGGPLKPSGFPLNQLVVPVPATTSLGEGFVSVQVVNTDTGFVGSNLGYALLEGLATAGLPTITKVNGHGLAATSLDPQFATANVETTLTQGSSVVLSGTGFDVTNGVAVDVFCACPGGKLPTTFINPGDPNLKSTSVTFSLPVSAPTGPGSIEVSNSGGGHTYNAKSQAVSVPIGARIDVVSVSQNGGTITVTGAGFSSLTVVNLFNLQAGMVVNLGGLKPDGTPKIPLALSGSTKFTFAVPAGAVPGPAFVQVLNPPFLPFTSSGNDPCGGFALH